MSNAIPQVDLHNYEMDKELGYGGFGKVYQVKKKSTGELFAAKESCKTYSISFKDNDFDKEMKSLSKLYNPSIIKTFGFSLTNFKGEPKPVMIMPYMPNSSLNNALIKNKSELTLLKKYIILLGISLAMEYLHSKKIVHRDLKPGNILLDENFYPYVSDFGISYISDEDVSKILMSTNDGTEIYQAPEIIKGEKFTYKVDIYAFGLIAYEVITGEKLFKGIKSKYKIINLIVEGKGQDTSMINNQYIINFLKSCWSIDPSKRPSFQDIVKTIKSKNFRKYFKVKKRSIKKYLSLFEPKSIDENKPKKEMKKLEMQEDSNEFLRLAILFETGENGHKIDQDKACYYYQKACDLRNEEAMIKYGRKLLNGNDTDKKKAANLYKQFADFKNPQAMNNYGLMLYCGNGIMQNKQLAFEYFKEAAKKGHSSSMMMCASMLYKGDEIPQDKYKAAEYYKASADKGKIAAAYNYAIMSLNGDGINKSINNAIHYIKIAIKEEHVEAMKIYADMNFFGDIIEQNKDEAIKYYKKCADKNDADASLRYSIIILTNKKSEYHKKIAAKYMKKAADSGLIVAIYNFGVMLFRGDGVMKDFAKSRQYITDAASKGYQIAQNFYDAHFLTEKDISENSDKNEKNKNSYILSFESNIEHSINQNITPDSPEQSKYDSEFFHCNCIDSKKSKLSDLFISSDYEYRNSDDLKKSSRLSYSCTSSYYEYSDSDDLKKSTSFSDLFTSSDIEFYTSGDLKRSIHYKDYSISNKVIPYQSESSYESENNSCENSSKLILTKKRLASPIFLEVIDENNKNYSFGNNGDIFFYDGMMMPEKYSKFNASKHVNKIPGLCIMCKKKNFFKNLNILNSKNLDAYREFIPITYLLPEEKESLPRLNLKMPLVLKHNSSGHGIDLISDSGEIASINSNSIIQQFISPYLINGYKFDIRIYLMITNLDPLTMYIYNEGEAYFCLERFSSPINANKNTYSFQKELPKSSTFQPIQSISSIIKKISKKSDDLWRKMKRIAALSVISIYEDIKKIVVDACNSNDFEFNSDGIEIIPPLKRFYNLIGIDILIDENKNPFILGINDNPGMKPLNDFDKNFKFELIKSEFELFANILNNSKNMSDKWEQILPSNEFPINDILTVKKIKRSPSKRSLKPKIEYIDM